MSIYDTYFSKDEIKKLCESFKDFLGSNCISVDTLSASGYLWDPELGGHFKGVPGRSLLVRAVPGDEGKFIVFLVHGRGMDHSWLGVFSKLHVLNKIYNALVEGCENC